MTDAGDAGSSVARIDEESSIFCRREPARPETGLSPHTGNHAEQNQMKPCRGKPFDLWKSLELEKSKRKFPPQMLNELSRFGTNARKRLNPTLRIASLVLCSTLLAGTSFLTPAILCRAADWSPEQLSTLAQYDGQATKCTGTLNTGLVRFPTPTLGICIGDLTHCALLLPGGPQVCTWSPTSLSTRDKVSSCGGL